MALSDTLTGAMWEMLSQGEQLSHALFPDTHTELMFIILSLIGNLFCSGNQIYAPGWVLNPVVPQTSVA